MKRGGGCYIKGGDCQYCCKKYKLSIKTVCEKNVNSHCLNFIHSFIHKETDTLPHLTSVYFLTMNSLKLTKVVF